jgi:hypothetical protein
MDGPPLYESVWAEAFLAIDADLPTADWDENNEREVALAIERAAPARAVRAGPVIPNVRKLPARRGADANFYRDPFGWKFR